MTKKGNTETHTKLHNEHQLHFFSFFCLINLFLAHVQGFGKLLF